MNFRIEIVEYVFKDVCGKIVCVCLVLVYDLVKFVVVVIDYGLLNWLCEFIFCGDCFFVEDFVKMCSWVVNGMLFVLFFYEL